MRLFLKKRPQVVGGLILAFVISPCSWSIADAQSASPLTVVRPVGNSRRTIGHSEPESSASGLSPTLERYFDPLQGTSSSDLVRCHCWSLS